MQKNKFSALYYDVFVHFDSSKIRCLSIFYKLDILFTLLLSVICGSLRRYYILLVIGDNWRLLSSIPLFLYSSLPC